MSAKNDARPAADPRSRASRRYPGSVSYLRALDKAGLRARRRLLQPQRRAVLEAAGNRGLLRRARRRQRRASSCAWTASPPRTRSSRARAGSASSRTGRGLRGRAGRRRRRARRELRPRGRGEPRRAARGAARARRRRRRRRSRRTAVIIESGVHRRAVGGHRGRPAARRAGPGRVGVRALQRPHRTAREPRRGRAVRAPRDVPERVLRDAPAALRRGRLRLPGGRPDGRQRHQRQDDPAARRRRAVRHPLRRAAGPPPHARPARRRRCAGRSAGARRPAARSRSDRPASSRSCSAAWPRSATRCSRATVAPLRVVAQSELVANEPSITKSDDPRAAAAMRAPLDRGGAGGPRPRVVLVHRTRESGLRMAAGMDHVVQDVDGLVAGAEAAPDLGRVWLTAELRPDAPLRVHEVPRAYGWSSQRSLPSVRDQVDAAVASRQAHRLGRRCVAEPARLPRRLLGARRRRDRRRRRAPAGRALRALSRAAGGRAGRAPRDRRQGPDRARLRRPRVLGHRDLRAAAAHLHAARGGRDALRWRHATLDLALERARRCAWRARRSRGARSAGTSARRTGRPGPRRFTSTPTSPTPSSAT